MELYEYFCRTIQLFKCKTVRFIGNPEAKIDAKCRVFIPAAFRKILLRENQEVLYLRKDLFQDCLVVYPESVWEEELTLLRSKLNKWIPEEQEVYRQFMLEAESVVMDDNGRILISRNLLDLVGIGNEVRFLGVDNTIEIWPKEALKTKRVPNDVFINKICKVMGSGTVNE